MSIKGILINCNTGNKSVVDLEYEIRTHNGVRYFKLLNEVTGYESFLIDDYNGKTDVNKLERIRNNGWRACMGTQGVWDELIITAEEMRKALGGVK